MKESTGITLGVGLWLQRFGALRWIFSGLAFIGLVHPPSAQAQQFIPCAGGALPRTEAKLPLITIPEIAIPKPRRDRGFNILKAVVVTADQKRNLWPVKGTGDCSPQFMRYFKGRSVWDPPNWWEDKTREYSAGGFPEPIPGPTLRARVGDLVEITFLNQINAIDFGYSIDRGEKGLGCDEVRGSVPPSAATSPDWQSNATYAYGSVIKPTSNNAGGYYFFGSLTNPDATSGTSGSTRPTFPQVPPSERQPGGHVDDGGVRWTNVGANPLIYPGSDKMPNCIHGSSTTNIHFHGTHTTPSTTGDNVLLQIRPSLRNNATLVPTEKDVETSFGAIFDWCEKNGSPTQWAQLIKLPGDFPAQQMGTSPTMPGGWIGEYDKTTPYKTVPLWPPNNNVIKQGGWPQYYIGAFPYCFRLPHYKEIVPPNTEPTLMGQAPGTHWYHAHKHGSTDINVSSGMTGALIIEGEEYDGILDKYYKSSQGGLTQQVMVFQQLTTTPSLLSGPGGQAVVAVNGRLQPFVTMSPNEVQMWRLVNTNSRSMITLCSFTSSTSGAPVPQWVQIAQDGVQYAPSNYNPGKPNLVINMATGNRVDLLVQAPATAGISYQLNISNPSAGGAVSVAPGTCASGTTTPLLTVQVQGSPVGNPKNFIPQNNSSPCVTSPNSFPCLPSYLDNIPGPIDVHRELVFNSVANVAPPTSASQNPNPTSPPFPGARLPRTLANGNPQTSRSHFINNRQFEDHRVDRKMLLNDIEEWKVMNLTTSNNAGPGAIWHPFHIHINPFQVTEVFDPNGSNASCVVPTDPKTWKPCSSPPGYPPQNFIWWDVFAIPSGKAFPLAASVCTQIDKCPKDIRDFTACTTGTTPSCTVTVPGYFIMRTRFADFTGQYVLHCHILAHEDRGMMELVEVVSNKTIYGHD